MSAFEIEDIDDEAPPSVEKKRAAEGALPPSMTRKRPKGQYFKMLALNATADAPLATGGSATSARRRTTRARGSSATCASARAAERVAVRVVRVHGDADEPQGERPERREDAVLGVRRALPRRRERDAAAERPRRVPLRHLRPHATDIRGLGSHRRFCDGGVWRCRWCMCKAEECSGKGPGPDGASTLCAPCSGRFHGDTGVPPPTNADGSYVRSSATARSTTSPAWARTAAAATAARGAAAGATASTSVVARVRPRATFPAPPSAPTPLPCPQPAIPVRRSQGPGPDGNKTLCSTCSARFRSGHTKPPQTNDDGKYVCGRARAPSTR